MKMSLILCGNPSNTCAAITDVHLLPNITLYCVSEQQRLLACGFAISEPRHDKTNKMSMCPAKTQISLGIRRVFDLSLRWAHSHFVGFVMSRFK